MAASAYNRAKYLAAKGDLDLDTADLRAMLVTSSYTFNADHDFVSDVVANEISASGYARQTLGGHAVTLDDTNDRAYADFNDVAFGAIASGATSAKLIVYKQVTNDSDHVLVGCYDFAVVTNGGTVTAQINTGGLLRFS